MLYILTLALAMTGMTFAQGRTHRDFIEYRTTGGMRASYNSVNLGNTDEALNLHGASFGYHIRIPLSLYSPVYLETGGGANYMGGNLTDDSRMDVWSIYAPVHIGYCYTLERGVDIFPYAGLNLRCNLAGHLKSDGRKYDFFDRDEVGPESVMKRYQAAYTIGISFTFNGFVLGTSFMQDLTDIASGTKVSMAQLTLGFNF